MQQKSIYLFILLILEFLTTISARCLNWCSKNGICTDPGEAGYCICDTGYHGADCSRKICPKAYDTLTISHNESRRTLRLTIGRESGPLSGKLKLQFHDDIVTLEADPSVIYTNDCSKSFSSFKGISKATCQAEQEWSAEALSYSYLVTIHEWSLFPQENNLFFHNGNPDINEFRCDVDLLDESTIVQPYCEVSDVVNSNLPEYLECGNHGKCDFKYGTCVCQHGFHGDACHDISDRMDELAAVHDGPFFTGTVIRGLAVRSPSDEFNLLELGHTEDILHSNHTVTRIRGDGLFEHRGESMLMGQTTISSSKRNRNALLTLSYNISHSNLAENSIESKTMIDSTAFSSADYHLRLKTIFPRKLSDQEELSYATSNVVNITGHGDIQASGSLSVSDGKFSVVDGLVTTQSVNVKNSLDVYGTAMIEESLTIGSGFALTPEGMTIDTSSHKGPLLELRSSQRGFIGAFLEINSLTQGETPMNSSMIRAAVDGFTTFDLKTNGHLIVNGIQMKSGGFVVSSGGINIESGGLTVRGGITLESGILNLKENEIMLSSITLENRESQSNVLQINNLNPYFVGPLISINDQSNNREKYLIVDYKQDQTSTFQLDSKGNLYSAGSMKLNEILEVGQSVNVNGILSFKPHQVSAGDEVILPSNVAFVELSDDHSDSANNVILPSAASPGQLLILRNLDATSVYLSSKNQANHQSKRLKVQPDVTIILVFNGYHWIDIQSLSTSIDKLRNIQELTFQNDVDVGNVTMTTGGLRMNGLNKGEVLVGGIGGSIRGRKGLTYSNGVLSTQGLMAQSLESDIDGNSKTISNVILSQPLLLSATITASSVTIPKASGVAYFNQKGELRSSSSVQLSDDGHLQITEIHNSINFHNNSLQNISSLSCSEMETQVAKVQKLYLGIPGGNERAQLLALSGDGAVESTPLYFNPETNEIFVERLHVKEQRSDVNYNQHKIMNATLQNGVAQDLNHVSTQSLQILLKSPMASPKTLAVVDQTGMIAPDSKDSVVPIVASSLEVNNIHVTSTQTPVSEQMTLLGTTKDKVVSGKDLTYSNGELHAPQLKTGKLEVSDIYLKADTFGASTIVSVDANGKLHSASTAKVEEIQTQTLRVNGHSKFQGDVQLTGLSSTVLSVNQEGRIVSGNDARFQSVVSQQGTFTSLTLDQGSSGILQTDSNGLVTSSKTISVNSIESSLLTADQVTTNELFLKNYLGAALLATDSSGKLRSSSDFVGESIRVQQGHVKNLQTEKLSLSSVPPNSLLGTGTDGEVVASQKGQIDSLEVNSLQISQNLVIPSSIQFTGDNIKKGGILVSDDKGMVTVSEKADIMVNSLHAQDNVIIDGELTAHSITFPKLERSNDDNHQIIHVSSTGKVESLSALVLRSLNVKTSVTAPFGKFQNIELSNLPFNQPLVLSEHGRVSTTSEISVDAMKAQRVESTTGKFNELLLNPTGEKSGILKVDEHGLISVAERLEIPSILVNSGLEVLGETRIDSLYLQSSGLKPDQNYFLQLNTKTGQVTPTSVVHVSALTSESFNGGRINAAQLILETQVEKNTLLMVTPSGQVTASDSKGKYSVGSLEIGDASISRLSLKINDPSDDVREADGHGVLTLSSSGQVMISKKGSLSHLRSDSINVKNIHITENIQLNPETLKGATSSNKRGTVLTLNTETHEVSLNPQIEVNSIECQDISATNVAASSLQLPLIHNSLVGTNSDGVLVKSDELSGRMNALRTKSLSSDLVEAKSIKLSETVTSGSRLLSVKSDGVLEPVSEVSVPSVSADSVDVELNPGILRIDEQGGAVSSTSHLHLDEIKAKNLEVTSSLRVSELTLTVPMGSTGFLTVDANGKLKSTSSGKLEDVQTQSLRVSGHSKFQGDVQLTGLSNTVLSVNQEGRIVSGNDATLGDISTKSLNNKGKLITSEIEIQSFSTEGVVVAKSNGHLTSSTDIKVNTLNANNLQVGSESQLNGLTVRSLKISTSDPRSDDEILMIDPTGKVSSKQVVNRLHANEGKISDLIVSNKLTSKSIQLQLSSTPEFENSVVTSDRNGHLQLSSELGVKSLKVQKKLTVSEELETESIRIKNLKPMSFLITDSNGQISSSNQISVSPEGTIKIRDLEVETLKEDLNLNKKKLHNGVIAKSQIIDSEITVPSESKRGSDESALAVVDQESGVLGRSTRITITKSGSMKIGALHPAIEDGSIQIYSAELHSPHLLQARVDAKEVKTTNLVVIGTSDLNGNVFVDGSVTVRGSVIGSGPYIDTSDSRFKTNITHLSNSLEIVKQMNGVTYDNRVDDFPSYHFDDTRQLGWIADDVVELVPELIYTDDKGYRHIAYSRAVALLGEAIKELSTECDVKQKELKEKIENQAKEIEELRKIVMEFMSSRVQP